MPNNPAAVEVAIAIGSNLGDRHDFIKRALEKVDSRVGVIQRQSTIYETEAVTLADYDGPQLPSYLNMAVCLETDLEPRELLSKLQEIELELGRDRSLETKRWISRTIDLDIIFYAEQVIVEDGLTIPHPEMHKREFVLKPLVEIAPELIHPELKKSVKDLYLALSV